MKWISVEDELPDLGKFVLVCSANHQTVFTATLEHSQNPYFEDNEEGYFWEGRNLTSLALADISHWMPLPEPPRLEGE